MPKIIFLATKVRPEEKVIEAPTGISICEAALKNGVNIEHACEMSCACTTCHVIIKKGYASLEPPDDWEEDLLDRAWGLTSQSRLSCQARVGTQDLEIEIPQYSINQVSEND